MFRLSLVAERRQPTTCHAPSIDASPRVKVAREPARVREIRVLLGLLFSTAISLLAHRRRSLSSTGIAGAIITGTTTFGLGGWSWGLSLIFFFVSSSIFSHFRAPDKAHTAADKFSEGGQRDIGQAAANGGIATLLALGYGLTSSASLQQVLSGLYRCTGYGYG